MNSETKQQLKEQILTFKLPHYSEVPDVGLYLDQTVKFINGYMKPFPWMEITASMVSNYVKKGLITNPVKKQYNREQIIYLIFIAVAKTVLSMENISLLFEMQKKTYTAEIAYNYFCLELENHISYVYGLKDQLDLIGHTASDEKVMLQTAVSTVAHKMYLDQCFDAIRKETE